MRRDDTARRRFGKSTGTRRGANPHARRLNFVLRPTHIRMRPLLNSYRLFVGLAIARQALESPFEQMLLYRQDWRYREYGAADDVTRDGR